MFRARVKITAEKVSIFRYIVVNEPYLELWVNCNIVRSYKFGTTYSRGSDYRFELEAFYDNEPCQPGFFCRKYLVDMYVEKNGEIERKTLPAGNYFDSSTFWTILR